MALLMCVLLCTIQSLKPVLKNWIANLIHEQEMNCDFYIQVQGALEAIFMDAYVYSH